MIGQLPKYGTTSSTNEQIFLPNQRLYHCPMDGHPGNPLLEGVGVYINNQRCKPVRSALVFGRSFQTIHGNNEKSSKKPSSGFTRRYPFTPPLHPELGG